MALCVHYDTNAIGWVERDARRDRSFVEVHVDCKLWSGFEEDVRVFLLYCFLIQVRKSRFLLRGGTKRTHEHTEKHRKISAARQDPFGRGG